MPADQAAAGTGRGDVVQGDAETGRVFGDLQPRRALARDDAGIVIGLDQGRAPLGADPRGNRFAVVAHPVVENDLRAIGAGALDLGLGASAGITIRAGMPKSCAAAATPWA